MGRKRSVISIANDQVSIIMACQLVGMDLPEDFAYGRSMKVHCPFGEIYHVDQGAEAAFRVYLDSNSAYCFAGCGYFSPVWLVAHAWGKPSPEAAADLLERIGHKPLSLDEAWASALNVEVPPDRTLLAEALKTYCARICATWSNAQFEPAVAATLTRCLTLLDRVATGEQAREWLDGCKTVMKRALASSGVPLGM